KNYRKGIEKGLLKILSKMGISTIASYRGAQLLKPLDWPMRVSRPVLKARPRDFKAGALRSWRRAKKSSLNKHGLSVSRLRRVDYSNTSTVLNITRLIRTWCKPCKKLCKAAITVCGGLTLTW